MTSNSREELTSDQLRHHEAEFLLRAASRLEALRRHWDPVNATRSPALAYNQHLWSMLACEAAETDTPLPCALGSTIGNLRKLVMRRTEELEQRPAPEKLECLIQINREVAADLCDTKEI